MSAVGAWLLVICARGTTGGAAGLLKRRSLEATPIVGVERVPQL